MDVGLFNEDLACFDAQSLDLFFGDDFAAHELLNLAGTPIVRKTPRERAERPTCRGHHP